MVNVTLNGFVSLAFAVVFATLDGLGVFFAVTTGLSDVSFFVSAVVDDWTLLFFVFAG